jgi:YidC/Oxa1 family membrane protein insertase
VEPIMTALSDLVGWLLAGFYSLVPNYAVAIILLGITFMALIMPLTLKSTRSMLAMQKLQPRVKQLQEQHRNDRLALNQAITELYKQEGVNPLGGCLPSLLPLPLFYVLYKVLNGLGHKVSTTCKGIAAGKSCAAPLYLNHNTRMYKDLVASALHTPGQGAHVHAFGIDLGSTVSGAIENHLGLGDVIGSLLLLVLMIGANYYQQVQIMNLNPMARQNQQMRSQMQFMKFFPIIFGLICIRLPAGVVLYYAISALFRVGQQWAMYRYDPKVKALVAHDIADLGAVEARFSDLDKPPSKPRQQGGTGNAGSRGQLPPARPKNLPPSSPTKQRPTTGGQTSPRAGQRQNSRNRKRKGR